MRNSARRDPVASTWVPPDRARGLVQRLSAWPAQWFYLGAAAPCMLFEALGLDYGWLGVSLLVVQQALRLLNHEEQRRRFDLPVTWPAAGLAGMAVVGLVVSPTFTWSMVPFFGLLFNVAVYTTIISSLRAAGPGADRARRLWIAVGIYVGLGVLAAIAGILQAELRRTDFFLVTALRNARPEIPPLVGALLQPLGRRTTHPNTFAGALTLFLPFYLALLLYRPWRERSGSAPDRAGARSGGDRSVRWLLATGLALAFVALAFITTLSRAGLVAIAVGLLLLLAWRWRHAGPAAKTVAAGLVALAGLSWGTTILWGWPSPLGFVAQAINSTRLEDAPGTFGVRVRGWIYAVEVIAHHPWTGVGLNRASEHLLSVDPWFYHAHNLFLQVALDFGLPGLLFFVALLTIALARVCRALRALAGTPEEGIAAGVAAALVAHLVWSMADTISQGLTPTVLLWVLLGLAVCLPISRPAARSEPATDEPADGVPPGDGLAGEPRLQATHRRRRRRLRARSTV